MTTWKQLHLTVSGNDADNITTALESLDSLAITITDAEDHPLFQNNPGETPLWDKVVLSVLFTAETKIEPIINNLIEQKLLTDTTPYHYEDLKEQDWVRQTQKQFESHCIREKLWVVPEWDDQNKYNDPKIIINPGLAFGTGTHPTTTLCLEWIVDNPPTNLKVVDYGCGSGILALAAIAMGADSVIALDHDSQAVLATKQNSVLNPMMQSKIIAGDAAILPRDQAYPYVIANILAQPLLELHSELTSKTTQGGQLILSGLLTTDIEKIVERYQNEFKLIDLSKNKEWVRLVFTKI